jgi:energy-coupling factor transporter transmembrane protein EcfT
MASISERADRSLFIGSVVVSILVIPAFIELALMYPPGIKAYAAYGAVCTTLVLLWRQPHRTSLFIIGAVSLGLVILHFVPWSPRKVFLQHFNRVQVGMTPGEVAGIMQPYEYGEQKKGLGVVCRTYVHDRADGRFDSDWGQITFVAGRVVKTKFLAD